MQCSFLVVGQSDLFKMLFHDVSVSLAAFFTVSLELDAIVLMMWFE